MKNKNLVTVTIIMICGLGFFVHAVGNHLGSFDHNSAYNDSASKYSQVKKDIGHVYAKHLVL